MKIIFIVVAYKTPEGELARLRREITDLGLKNYELIIIDNTGNNRGYGAAANEGIRQGLDKGGELFVVMNPDVSLKGLTAENLLAGSGYFDICGGRMKQQGKDYYGGIIDRWRLSGGLAAAEPADRFSLADFVSGSLIIIKKGAIDKIGFFREDYFMYYEDVEYCRRATKAGLRVGIDKDLAYEHFENSPNKEKTKWLFINRFKFFWQHSGNRERIREAARLPLTLWQDRQAIWSLIINSPFLVNFFSFNVASFVNKGLNFILFILLIRWLTPADYGGYNLIWAQATLLAPLLDLGTTTYGLVHLPREEKQGFLSLFSLRIFVSVIVFATTMALAVFILKYDWLLILGTLFAAVVIFSNMMSGTYLILAAGREKLLFNSAVSAIFNAVMISGLAMILFTTRKLLPIFFGVFIFYSLYTIVNYSIISRMFGRIKVMWDMPVWKNIILKSYPYMLVAIFAQLYFKLDIFMLNFLKGKTEVGIYSAGYNFLEALTFVGSAYTVSSMPALSRLAGKDNKRFLNKLKKDILFLTGIGLSVIFAVWAFVPVLLHYAMRSFSAETAAVSRITILALPFILIETVFYNSFYVHGKTKWVIGLFVFQTLFNIAANWLLIPHFSYFASSWITVLSEVSGLLICVLLFSRLFKNII